MTALCLHVEQRRGLKFAFVFAPQPPLNAQMLAQRQRELYSIQHRQRQLFQQKVMLMRQNMASAAPMGGTGFAAPAAVVARVPKGANNNNNNNASAPQQQTQFNFSAGYIPVSGNPPTSPGQFSGPMPGGAPIPGSPLDGKLNSQTTLLGGVQAPPFGGGSPMQQFGGAGEYKHHRLHSK